MPRYWPLAVLTLAMVAGGGATLGARRAAAQDRSETRHETSPPRTAAGAARTEPRPPMKASSTVEVIESTRAVDDVIARVRAERARAAAHGERQPPQPAAGGAPRSPSAHDGSTATSKRDDRPHLGQDGSHDHDAAARPERLERAHRERPGGRHSQGQ
jgi:hypothetical protein